MRARARRGLGHAAWRRSARCMTNGPRRLNCGSRPEPGHHRAAHAWAGVLGAVGHAAGGERSARGRPGAVSRCGGRSWGRRRLSLYLSRLRRRTAPQRPARRRVVGQHPALARRRMDGCGLRSRCSRCAWWCRTSDCSVGMAAARTTCASAQRAEPAGGLGQSRGALEGWGAGGRGATALLRAMSAEVVGGPGSDGVWRLRVRDRVRRACTMLAASPLVEVGRAGRRSGHDARVAHYRCLAPSPFRGMGVGAPGLAIGRPYRPPGAPIRLPRGEGHTAWYWLQLLSSSRCFSSRPAPRHPTRPARRRLRTRQPAPGPLAPQAPRNDVTLMRDVAPEARLRPHRHHRSLADGVSGAALPDARNIHDALSRLRRAIPQRLTSCCCTSPATAPTLRDAAKRHRQEPDGLAENFLARDVRARSAPMRRCRAACAMSTSTAWLQALARAERRSSGPCSTPALGLLDDARPIHRARGRARVRPTTKCAGAACAWTSSRVPAPRPPPRRPSPRAAVAQRAARPLRRLLRLESHQVTPELRLPRKDRRAQPQGLLTWAVGRSALQRRPATWRELFDSVLALYPPVVAELESALPDTRAALAGGRGQPRRALFANSDEAAHHPPRAGAHSANGASARAACRPPRRPGAAQRPLRVLATLEDGTQRSAEGSASAQIVFERAALQLPATLRDAATSTRWSVTRCAEPRPSRCACAPSRRCRRPEPRLPGLDPRGQARRGRRPALDRGRGQCRPAANRPQARLKWLDRAAHTGRRGARRGLRGRCSSTGAATACCAASRCCARPRAAAAAARRRARGAFGAQHRRRFARHADRRRRRAR